MTITTRGRVADLLATSPSSAGLPALFLGILAVESGVPIPIPADLLVIVAGERASAGSLPLWAAILVLEVVACIGTTLLYLAARGPGRALVRRVTRRLSALADRAERLTSTGGIRALAGCSLGRATPGLRTLTVVTAATLHHRARLVLPALIVGSTVFLQVHLMLGFAVGAAADGLLARARTAAVVVLVAIATVSAIVWIRRRGRSAGEQSLAEAGCPACLALGVIGDRLAGPEGGWLRPT